VLAPDQPLFPIKVAGIMKPSGKYTCVEYRQEMLLLGLKRQLEDPRLVESERIRIAESVRELEQRMGLD
jgi:hypothetical protein